MGHMLQRREECRWNLSDPPATLWTFYRGLARGWDNHRSKRRRSPPTIWKNTTEVPTCTNEAEKEATVMVISTFFLPLSLSFLAVVVGLEAPTKYHAQHARNLHTSTTLQRLLAHSEAGSAAKRALFWSNTESLCSVERFNSLAGAIDGLAFCLDGTFQWDRDGILSGSWLFTNSYTTISFLGSPVTLPVPITTYTAEYLDSGVCEKFDGCVNAETEDIVGGQYSYDCSNVYCGPNARRDCNGNYQDTVCPAGVDESALVDIPTLRDVNCQRFRSVVDENFGVDVCTPCEEESGDLNVIECGLDCLGCNADGVCVTTVEAFGFSEIGDVYESCSTVSDTEDEWCLIYLGPPGIGETGTISQFQCGFSLNDEDCDCSICGTADPNGSLFRAGEVFFRADCSSVVPNSIFDQCSDTYSGAFSILGDQLDENAVCTEEQMSSSMTTPPIPVIPIAVASPASSTPAPVASVPLTSPPVVLMPPTFWFQPTVSPLVTETAPVPPPVQPMVVTATPVLASATVIEPSTAASQEPPVPTTTTMIPNTTPPTDDLSSVAAPGTLRAVDHTSSATAGTAVGWIPLQLVLTTVVAALWVLR